MAAPREGGWSEADRLKRLLAGSLASAAVDARAHGSSGLEWLAIPFLISIAGVFVTFLVCAVMARGDWTLKVPLGIAWATADVVLSVAGTWLLGMTLQAILGEHWRGGGTPGLMIVWAMPLLAWSLPIALFVHWSWRR